MAAFQRSVQLQISPMTQRTLNLDGLRLLQSLLLALRLNHRSTLLLQAPGRRPLALWRYLAHSWLVHLQSAEQLRPCSRMVRAPRASLP